MFSRLYHLATRILPLLVDLTLRGSSRQVDLLRGEKVPIGRGRDGGMGGGGCTKYCPELAHCRTNCQGLKISSSFTTGNLRRWTFANLHVRKWSRPRQPFG